MNNTIDETPNTNKNILQIILTVLVVAAAGYFVILFLYISISRMAFPLSLDWVEGATLVQANRLLLGQKMYIAPDIDYIPLVYPPLYFYLGALLMKVLGVGFMPFRLISILATCVCILSIFLITQKISGGKVIAALTAAGLFAATNETVYTWFDLARVDMLCVSFFMAGLYFVLLKNQRGSILAGILFALSVFSKQTYTPIILLICAYYFFVNRKQALILMAVFGSIVGAGTLALTSESNGTYLFYVYRLPTYHQLSTQLNYIRDILVGFLQPFLVALAVIIVSAVLNLKKMLKNQDECLLVIITIATTLFSIWSGLLMGSTRNAFIPTYALIAVMFGLALVHLTENSTDLWDGKFKRIATPILLCVCLLQFSLLQYSPNHYIPTPRDYIQATRLINAIRVIPEEVLLPTQNYLALLTGKKTYYNGAALGEFNGDFGTPLSQMGMLKDKTIAALRSKEVGYVFMNKPKDLWYGMKCQTINIFQANSRFIQNLYKMTCK